MDSTPSRSRSRTVAYEQACQEHSMRINNGKIKKPPPITPRRFTRFFTPRPRHPSNVVKTSRAALRVIAGAALNTRNGRTIDKGQSYTATDDTTPRGKKRKLSFVIAENSVHSSPISRVSFASSQDLIRSSPTIPERRTPIRRRYSDVNVCDTEDETDIEAEDEDAFIPQLPRIMPYRTKTVSGGILSTRLGGRRAKVEVVSSTLWQTETAGFYTGPQDIHNDFLRPSATLPFSTAACHTNPLVAIGDEEGRVRLLDTSVDSKHGLTKAWINMRPHDNAIMDLEFSADDQYLATASGDQSCQIIDVQTQRSLCLLGDHRCSVKRIAFQPGSGNQILASCGRDGQVNFWDLRCNNTLGESSARGAARRKAFEALEMTSSMKIVAPTHMIRDAHSAGVRSRTTGTKARPNLVPGRTDFSITSLCFLGESKPHLLATASEIDSTIKVWDIRTSYGASRRAPQPLSIAEEPKSHARHRSFGITSLVLNTDGSRLYSLSRDHTVYAYATSHLILGSSRQTSPRSKASKPTDNNVGLGPLYGFRHPSLLIQTFWPRLAIRKATHAHPELLAIGSSDDCAVLFPTNERYLTSSTKEVPSLHQRSPRESSSFQDIGDHQAASRPRLTRSTSSFNNRLYSASFGEDSEPSFPIYQHGTPLIRGHDKEVTSLAWTSEGSLVTASDDYTVRCWRESPHEAREMRSVGEKNGSRFQKGWSDVGITDFDDEY